MLTRIRRFWRLLNRVIDRLSAEPIHAQRTLDHQLLLLGRSISWQVRQKDAIGTLEDVEFQVYSQWGEDGIIDWLVENVPIDDTTFVEFGVENYLEANTRFLLQNRNWRGLVMDSNPTHVAKIEGDELYWRHDIKAVSAFVTRQNIDNLLGENEICGDIGLLCIDIDGNDYWVLDAINVISPRILVCEYNPIFGDLHAITIPYNPDFQRLKAHPSGQYFGASIKAIRNLAMRKGYEFVGTCSNGINAFFVRKDLFGTIADKITDRRAFPSRHRDSRDEAGCLTHVAGARRADLIKSLPVLLIEEGNREAPIASLYPLYSDDWMQHMR